MDFASFAKLYPDLPHDIALYYSDIKRGFNLSHERAYEETLKFARLAGKTVGDEAGKPAHECRRIRLLRRSEL